MVKLVSVRTTRLYGSRRTKDVWEDANAFGYLIGVLLATAGAALLLPGYKTTAGLWLALIGLVLIFVANVHDVYAQLAGFDFRLPLVTLDPQLAVIEITGPLLNCIGALLYFIGGVLYLRIARGDIHSFDKNAELASHAENLFVAAPALWLAGAVLNAFQVYESAGTQVQLMQKGVAIPFVLGSTFLLCAGITNSVFQFPMLKRAATLAVGLTIAGSALLLTGGVVNVVRVIQLQQYEHLGGVAEKLRGGAQERLISEREREEWARPLARGSGEEIEGGDDNPYSVVEAERVEVS